MDDIIKEFFNQKDIAVIGSFRSKDKVAYKILLQLKEKCYNVIPVNPSLLEVEGLKCYPAVIDIPSKVDPTTCLHTEGVFDDTQTSGGVTAVSIVTPPEATEKIVEDCKKKNIKYVWMQPGAESEKAIKFCNANGIKVIHNTCLMLKII